MKRLKELLGKNNLKLLILYSILLVGCAVKNSSYFDKVILENLKKYEDIAEIYDYRKIRKYDRGNEHIVEYQFKVKLKPDKVVKEAQDNMLNILKKSPFLIELGTRCGINFITGKQPCIIEDKAVFKKTSEGWILK